MVSTRDVLLVHAFPFDARFWADQVALAPADVRLHTFDLPGFGGAAEHPAQTIDDLAEAIHSAAMGLDRFVLCGLSMGGYAAFAYWRRYASEKRLAGIVFADTKAEADTTEGKAGRDGTIKLVEAKGASAVADLLLPRLLSPDASPEIIARARQLIEAQHPAGIAGASRAMRDRPDSTALLATINVPVLGMVGDADLLTPPPLTEAIVRGVPDGRLVRIPNAGHLSNLEQPPLFTDALVQFARHAT